MAFSASVHGFARSVFFFIVLVSSNAHAVFGCTGGPATVYSSYTCCATTPSSGWDYRITSSSNDHFSAEVYETTSSNMYYTATQCVVRSSGGSCTGSACVSRYSNTCDADSNGRLSSVTPSLLCLKISCDNSYSSCSFTSVSASFYTSSTPAPSPPPSPPPPPSSSWSALNGDVFTLASNTCSTVYTQCQAVCAQRYSVSLSGSRYTLTPAPQSSLPFGCTCYTLTGTPNAYGVMSITGAGIGPVTVTQTTATTYSVYISYGPCTLTYTRSTGASLGFTSDASRLTRVLTFVALIAGAVALV